MRAQGMGVGAELKKRAIAKQGPTQWHACCYSRRGVCLFQNPKDINMHKLPKVLLLAGCAGLPFLAGVARAQDAPEHTFTGKAALYSEYEYRGISQTSEKPAVQLNLDYAHKSGLYIGTFLSNIKWLKDYGAVADPPFDPKANIEWDIYAGYKFEVVKDVLLDVGYLRYEYPSSSEFNPKPNTDEVYVGVSYGPATVKYSYSINDIFGVANSKGSDYLELAVNYPIIDKVTLNGVVGHQTFKHNGFLSYTVWKLGATYDFGGGFNAGAYYKGTDAEEAAYTVKGKDWSKGRLVGFVSYAF
jgi:uncharacterized protein (TIGR02001 family)